MKGLRGLVVLAVSLPLPLLAYQRVTDELGRTNEWNTFNGPVEFYVSSDGTLDMEDPNATVAAVENAFRTWECVPCSTIQFKNMGAGPTRVDQDGKNTVLWMSNRAQIQSLIGADPDKLLATTINFDPDAHPFFEQDIVFNDTTFDGDELRWTNNPGPYVPDAGYIEVDIETVMLQQAGRFLGLDYNCDPPGSESCASLSVSVMAPAYGGVLRELRQDDIDGVCAIYPNDAGTPKCAGKRLRESCERDCDCEPGLLCVPDGDNGRMCSKACDADNPICPNQTGCVLAPRAGEGGGRGLCLRRNEDNANLDGMVCDADSNCESLNCSRVAAIGKQVCLRGCADSSQCAAGYTCLEGACLLPSAGAGVSCDPPAAPPPAEEGPFGCAHDTAPLQDGASVVGFALGVLLIARWRRSRGR